MMSDPYRTAAALMRKYLIPEGGPRPIRKAPELAMPYTPPKKPGPVDRAKNTGQHLRFFWRVRHRIGPGWDKLPEREIRKLLRQMSWRRAL